MIALISLYSTIGAVSSSIIDSISTSAYASNIAVPSKQQGIINLSSNEGDSITPAMAGSGNNRVYVAWIDDTLGYGGKVFVAKSTDGGIAFGNATILSRNSSLPKAPQIAASGSNVYVSWYDNITGNYEPFLVVSTDNGTNFSNPINLSQKAGVSNKYAADEYGLQASFSQIAATGDELYAIWYNNITGTIQTFLTKSTDNGSTFSDPINLSQKAKVGSSISLAVSQNNVYVLWTPREGEGNKTSTAADTPFARKLILLVKSTDGGTTFSQPVIVTNEYGFGWIKVVVANNNNLYVAWRHETVEPGSAQGIMRVLSSGISLSKSLDGGTTFGQPINIIESENYIGGDFNIAATANNVYAVWSMDTSRDILSMESIFVAKSKDGGTTFIKPPIDVGNGRFPVVSVSEDNNNLYIAWLDNIGNAEIFFTKIKGNLPQLPKITAKGSIG